MRHEKSQRYRSRAELSSFRGVVAMLDFYGYVSDQSHVPVRKKDHRFTEFRRRENRLASELAHRDIADVRRAIKQQAEKQLNDNKMYENVIQGNDPESIFDSYRKSQLCDITFRELWEASKKVEDPPVLRSHLVGRIFEDIAFGLLSAANAPEKTLLSPRRTLIATRALSSEGRLSADNNLGHQGILGNRSMTPDGLLVVSSDKGQVIDSVVEYSVSRFKDWQRKHNIFKIKSRRFSDVFVQDPLFIAVVPEDYPEDLIPSAKDSRVLRTAFTSSAFGTFVRALSLEKGFTKILAL